MTVYDDDEFDSPLEALDHYNKLLKARRAYKRALEVQKAEYGIAVPAHVVTELDKVSADIKQLRERVKTLDAVTNPPPPAPVVPNPVPPKAASGQTPPINTNSTPDPLLATEIARPMHGNMREPAQESERDTVPEFSSHHERKPFPLFASNLDKQNASLYELLHDNRDTNNQSVSLLQNLSTEMQQLLIMRVIMKCTDDSERKATGFAPILEAFEADMPLALTIIYELRKNGYITAELTPEGRRRLDEMPSRATALVQSLEPQKASDITAELTPEGMRRLESRYLDRWRAKILREQMQFLDTIIVISPTDVGRAWVASLKP